ncbi:MAG TPA: hypothetical protein PK971_15270 [Saprospiraceae bacterium]|nr:hypothetical protein [Saprospiraceae bacterium]
MIKERFATRPPAQLNYGAHQSGMYEESLKYYRDLKNVIDTSYEEGRIEGKQEAQIEVARKALQAGLPPQTVAQITGMPIEEIQRL